MSVGGQLDAQGADNAGFAASRGQVDNVGTAAILIDHLDEISVLVDGLASH